MGAACDSARSCGTRHCSSSQPDSTDPTEAGYSEETESSRPESATRIARAHARDVSRKIQQESQSLSEPFHEPAAEVTVSHWNSVAAILRALRPKLRNFQKVSSEFQKVVDHFGASDFEVLVDDPELKVESKADPATKMPIVRYRSLVVGAEFDSVVELLHDVEGRAGWEAKYKVGKKTVNVIEESGSEYEQEQLVLFTYARVFLVDGREFLDKRATFKQDGLQKVYVQIAGAEKDGSRPVADGFVRGHTVFEGTVILETPEGPAVYVINLTDPKGHVPASGVRAASKNKPSKSHKALKKAYAAKFGSPGPDAKPSRLDATPNPNATSVTKNQPKSEPVEIAASKPAANDTVKKESMMERYARMTANPDPTSPAYVKPDVNAASPAEGAEKNSESAENITSSVDGREFEAQQEGVKDCSRVSDPGEVEPYAIKEDPSKSLL